ncbi:peroxisomal membrane protein [Zymoseptoria brevis]|uniref:Peroxisomal membrane protein n=1 Tax=Zymoseptoria brevis TaxID=1047168 RepID=A0A0F4GAF9_9PEZI|nr:peroxisomal membrane protein [Zymoseptoria brevis]
MPVDSINKIILDPRYHEPLVLVKAVRNGLVYGTKIRFPHALVLVFLFGSGTTQQKIKKILQLTRDHAFVLAKFAFFYKLICMVLKRANRGKEQTVHSFVAGLSCGYWVFGRSAVASSSVVQQMVMYAMGRVMMGLARLIVQAPGEKSATIAAHERTDWRASLLRAGWPVSASLCWGVVMWLFTWHPEVLQPTLRSSLTDIYVNSEKWDGLGAFLLRNH